MTDDQVLAKVRTVATQTLDRYNKCGGCLGGMPVTDGKHDWRGGGLVDCTGVTPTVAAISARVALALVEQWEWHRDEDAKLHSCMVRIHGTAREAHCDAKARLMAALRKAVTP